MVVLLAMTAAACAPVRLSHTNTVPTLRLESNRSATSELAGEPIAILGMLAPAGLQGFSPFLSHALVAALAEVTPPIPARSAYDTMNRLNAEGLAAEYSELVAGFARSGILERDRLRRIGSELGSRYVFLPGVAELSHTVLDKFEMAGLKLVRNQLTTLRLWLQLWDVQSGRLLWESVGETTVASPIVSEAQATSLHTIAQALWRRMIQDDLIQKDSGG